MRLFVALLICLFALFFADQEFWQGRYTQGLVRLAESIWRSFLH
jgi:hypothetical protein